VKILSSFSFYFSFFEKSFTKKAIILEMNFGSLIM
jgi:hypothetical protein